MRLVRLILILSKEFIISRLLGKWSISISKSVYLLESSFRRKYVRGCLLKCDKGRVLSLAEAVFTAFIEV